METHPERAVDTMGQVVSVTAQRMETARNAGLVAGNGVVGEFARPASTGISAGTESAGASTRLRATVVWLPDFLTVGPGDEVVRHGLGGGPTVNVSSDASVKAVDGNGGCGACCIELRRFIAWSETQEARDRAMRAVQASSMGQEQRTTGS